MDNKKSRDLLQQLHDEINHIQSVDEKSSDLLRDIDGDIRALLERSEEHQMQIHPSVVQRLESALSYYEVTHPKLTSLIAKVLASLSNAGI
jgi:hypothetical protein